MMERPVYLDYQATTPLDPAVRKAMRPYWREGFGNPHSVGHDYGAEAARALRHARAQVAGLINADDGEIVFTSGATESCNLALRGILSAAADGPRDRIVTVATEHPAVFETVQDLGRTDTDIVVLQVDSNGILDLARLDAALDERTLLVSVMAANNEIGVLQPMRDIAVRCHAAGALLHSDATQAAGRIPVDVEEWGVDLLSLSAHKMYGPKGAGALFVRSGVAIRPMVTGGGQEQGRRSGTVATPLVVGLGEACEIAGSNMAAERRRIDDLTARLCERIRNACPEMRLFGDAERRLPGSLSIGFPGVPADHVVRNLRDRIAIATGSACASVASGPSRVLLALGLDAETAQTALRVSLGRFTTEDDVAIAVEALSSVRVVLP
ncbi:MAG: cysteine desulfurase family protein [Boseongicola sp.]|nr:cysteine desulfurase family protein [Boseongicola sp.]